MKLSDFKMMKTKSPNGVQAILKFGDAYELSIIRSDFSYGGSKGLYEIGVFKNGVMEVMPGITAEGDTVKGWLTEKDVNTIIKKMYTVTMDIPVQI